jgi:hypothetical protein
VRVLPYSPKPVVEYRKIELVVGIQFSGTTRISDLRDPIGAVIAVGNDPAFGVCVGLDSIKGIIGEAGGGDPVGIDDRGKIAGDIVLEARRLIKGVEGRGDLPSRIVGILGRLACGICVEYW